MKIKNIVKYTIGILIISLLVSVIVVSKQKYVDLSYVSDVEYNDNCMYTINKKSQSYEYDILKISENNYVKSCISLNDGYITGKTNEKINIFDDIIMSDTGDVYIHSEERQASNGVIDSEKIFLCDFNKQRIKVKWQIDISDEVTDSDDYAFKIYYNKLYYIVYQNNLIYLYCVDDNGNTSLVSQYTYSDNVEFIDFYIMQDMSIAAYSSYAGVYLFNTDNTNGYCIYGDAGNQNSIINFDNDFNGNILFSDIKNKVIVKYNADGAMESTKLPYSFQNAAYYSDEISENMIKYDELKKTSYYSQNEYISVINSTEDNEEMVALVRYNDIKIYENIKLSFNMLAEKFLMTAVILFALSESIFALSVFMTKRAIKKKRIKYIPVAIKVMGISIIFTVIGTVLVISKTEKYIRQQIINERYISFIHISQGIKSQINGISNKKTNSDYFDYIKKILINDNYKFDGKLYMGEYHCLHKIFDGELYTMINDGSFENVPCSYVYSSYLSELYINTDTYTKITQHDSLGDWYALIYRIDDDTVLELGIEKYIIDYSIALTLRKIIFYLVLCFTVLLLFVTIITMLFLLPLRKLSLQVQSTNISKNIFNINYKAPNNILFGKNEITRISETIEFMYSSIMKRKNEIECSNIVYQKFIPWNILNIIEDEPISEREIGDNKRLDSVIIKFSFNNFINFDKHTDAEIFKYILNMINDAGGSVEYFNEDYIESIFTIKPENAVECAVCVINHINKKQKFKINCAISNGISMASIIGGNVRYQATIISYQKIVVEKLTHIASEFRCNLLISEYTYNQVYDFDLRFKKRYIGKIKLNEIISVYEVLDYCQSREMQLKLSTSDEFEKGLELFCTSKFADAKKHFINVIRQNNKDLVAKYYFEKCERYCTEKKNISIYFGSD